MYFVKEIINRDNKEVILTTEKPMTSKANLEAQALKMGVPVNVVIQYDEKEEAFFAVDYTIDINDPQRDYFLTPASLLEEEFEKQLLNVVRRLAHQEQINA